MDDFFFWFPLDSCRVIGASRGAKSAADTLFTVNDSHAPLLGDGLHLASVDAYVTSHAEIRIDLRIIVSSENRVLDTEFSETPEDATAAAATVADVADSLHHVAHCVDQTDLLNLVQEGEGLLF